MKIDKLKIKLNNNINILKNFGFKLAFYDFLTQIIFRKRNNYISKKIYFLQHENVKKYLIKKYEYILDETKVKSEICDNIEADCPIFIFWWQGLENAPIIVKKCIESIKEHSGKHEVIMISKDNYEKYADIPQYIKDKIRNGIISLTQFSDILRVSLLYKNGGIWLDSTVFLNKDIDKNVEQYKFYTVKHNLYSDYHICRGLWMGAILMSSRQNQFMKYLQKFFFEYWKNENWLITYLLIDCVISIGYDNISFIKEEIDRVPVNNTDVFFIENNLNNVYDDKIINMKQSQTYMFKLNYKRKYLTEKNGKETFYGKILRSYE